MEIVANINPAEIGQLIELGDVVTNIISAGVLALFGLVGTAVGGLLKNGLMFGSLLGRESYT